MILNFPYGFVQGKDSECKLPGPCVLIVIIKTKTFVQSNHFCPERLLINMIMAISKYLNLPKDVN